MATKKVAVYASLCTGDEKAIKTQITELVDRVNCEQEWSFNEETDIYSDIGCPKMQIKGRTGLDDMILKAKLGNYDLIVVRDVSRIARNGRLLGEIVSDLKECGVEFYFMNENIFTSSEEGYFKFLLHASQMCRDFNMRSERIKSGLQSKKLRENKTYE